MNRTHQLWVSICALTAVLCITLAQNASAQEFKDFIARTADKWSESPVINDSSLAILASFAGEWDKLSIPGHEGLELQVEPDLSVFAKTPPSTAQDLLKAFASQPNSLSRFENAFVQDKFNSIYSRAVESGSPIGMMSPNTVLEYWAASKVIADKESAHRDVVVQNLDYRQMICLWILWPCKPKPPPKDQD